MTMAEEKKLRHLIARFNNVKHSSVTVLSVEALENGIQKVRAKVQSYTIEYLLQGNAIEKAAYVV